VMDQTAPLEELTVDGDVVSFRRGDLAVVLNCGESAVPLPTGELVLASGAVTDELPGNTAVWLLPSR